MEIYVAPAPKESVTIAKIFISRKTFILKLLSFISSFLNGIYFTSTNKWRVMDLSTNYEITKKKTGILKRRNSIRSHYFSAVFER